MVFFNSSNSHQGVGTAAFWSGRLWLNSSDSHQGLLAGSQQFRLTSRSRDCDLLAGEPLDHTVPTSIRELGLRPFGRGASGSKVPTPIRSWDCGPLAGEPLDHTVPTSIRELGLRPFGRGASGSTVPTPIREEDTCQFWPMRPFWLIFVAFCRSQC